MPEPVRMIKPVHGEEMWLLGYTYEELPGDGHGWLSTWWFNLESCLADYVFVERLTTYDERNSWQTNDPPTWGVHKTSLWKPGTILRESRVVVAAEETYVVAALRWHLARRAMASDAGSSKQLQSWKI